MFLPNSIKKLSLILFLIYAFYSTFNTISSIHTNVIQKDQEYQEKILGLKDEKATLETKLNTINSNEFVEKEARSRLNMKKEGEEVYLISSNEVVKTEEVSYTETLPQAPNQASNLDRWMELLF